ncbi:MAG: aminopeptidase [Dehalococcoidia bacterium]|nr:aminopeptidase [Dehalococcoidia bacterium]
MKEAARIVVADCLGVKKSEEVLIIVDEKSRKIGKALFDAAKSLGAEAVLIEMIEREAHGSEPPRLVAEAMKSADVVIAPTSKSLTHTKARLEATKSGVRVASMPTITEELMSRTMSADYAKIKERSLKFRDLLSQGSEAHLTTPVGTDLTFSIAGREAIADTGILHEKGAFGNLPAGEAFIAPIEGKTSGIAVIDGSMASIGVIKTPIKMVVKDGYVTEISGEAEAKALSELLRDKGKEAKNIAELGIGTNEKATPSGSPLEDEKVMGTVHVAIGDNSTIGGKVKAPLHLDGIMKNPTLVIDGKTVIKDGKLLI